MERLSSCYFCGVAVEAEVREYPAVVGNPEGLDLPPEDERPTVPLCAGCRSKLDRIVTGLGSGSDSGAVGDAGAGDHRERDDRSAPDGHEAPESATEPAGTDPGAGEDEATATGGETANDAGGVPDRDDHGTGVSAGEDGDGDDPVGIDPDAEIFGDAEPVPLDGEDGGGDGGETAGDDAGSGADAEADDGGKDRDDAGPERDDGDENEDQRSYTASQAAGGRSTSSHGRDDSSDDGDGPEAGEGESRGDAGAEEVPREAYDKVVRLLQNREFPVESGDVLTVASNAYGLDRRDCEAAIDRLVEQGVLERDGDRLLRGRE